MRAVESLRRSLARQRNSPLVPGIEDTSIQRRRPLKLSMKAFCCGGQERFGTIGPEEAVVDFKCVTNPFSSVARTKLPARLLCLLSPSNFVSKVYEFQQLMSKSANPLR
jgi:hypothetical protein